MTFRMRGHEEASGTKYVPKELFEEWGRKDPVKNFEQFLAAENIMTEMQIADIRNGFKSQIESELHIAYNDAEMVVDTEVEMNDVYANSEKLKVKSYEYGILFFNTIFSCLFYGMKNF